MKGDVGKRLRKGWKRLGKREGTVDSVARGRKEGTSPTQWGAGEKEKERWKAGRRDRT